MMDFGKKLLLGAFAISALTMIGASADQAQAKIICKERVRQGLPCGGTRVRERIVQGNDPTYRFKTNTTKCMYFNSLFYVQANFKSWNMAKWIRCPNMTLKETQTAFFKFLNNGGLVKAPKD